jgi:hypothetical protein
MKASIKLAVGTTVEVEGTQEECVAAIHAALGLSGLGQAPVVIPTIWPVPAPYTPPVNPWPFITWGQGVTPPWESGTIISVCKGNTNLCDVASGPAGYRVQNDGLQPMSQGELLTAMGFSFSQTNEMAPALQYKTVSEVMAAAHENPNVTHIPESLVRVFMNDFDKGSTDCSLPPPPVVGYNG